MKRDRDRFPYALTRQGSPEVLSVISKANRDADTHAFDALVRHVGIATDQEGTFQDGKWVPGRTLNGDEIMVSYDFTSLIPEHQTGTAAKLRGATPQVQKVTLYRFSDSK